ncbi:endonuclease [Kaistella yonginensis]|uniref:endonuclease/exonuclease/phosphatase family protein n=1 Tax=Kaistella yonginensis TaxID=658267 RepID=UPI0025B30EB0|nr:endonuclease [Kaistella yonginensis]MDN3607900.1 endonuclease [Kaistella yonginensis]
MENNKDTELIAFYNVENLFCPDIPRVHQLDPTASGLLNWDERKYQNKLFKIAHVFQLILESEKALPLVIGLSEVQGRKPLEDLVKLEPFNSKYEIAHYESMDERGVDVALLYDKTKIELLSSQPISYLFAVENKESEYYDTTRDVLFCKVKFLETIINVFVLHLPSKREKDINKPKRDYILKDLHEKVLTIKSTTQEAVIIMGDFNENPDEEMILNFNYDSDFNKILVNPSEELFKNEKFSTFHYKNGLLFDQMILSKDFFNSNYPLLFKEAKVFNHEKLSNWNRKFAGRPFRTYAGTRYLGGYSDHFPILTALLVNK